MCVCVCVGGGGGGGGGQGFQGQVIKDRGERGRQRVIILMSDTLCITLLL